LPLHRRLVTDPDFVRGGVSIHHLEGRLRKDGAA